jgi:AraC-like DNA-binding protein
VSKLLILLLLYTAIGTPTLAQGTATYTDQELEFFLQKNQLLQAEAHLNQQLASETSLNAVQRVYYFNRKSQLELQKGAFSSSLGYAKKSENLLVSDPDSKLWGETFRVVCFAYIRLGKLDSALLYAEKLQDHAKKTQDPKLRRAALLALGNISLQNLAYQNSLEFYIDALTATEEAKDSINLKVDYYNVGLAYGRLKQVDKSNAYLLKASLRAEKEQVFDLLARCYGSIADNYLFLKNYSKQAEYLVKANQIAAKLGNTQLLAMGYANLMESQLQRKLWAEAISSGEKSLKELEKKPLVQLEAKVDSLLYVAYKENGEFTEALARLEDYDSLRGQIRNDVQKEKLDELTLLYDVEKKDLLIKTQEAELEKEKTKSRLLITGIIAVLVILGLIAYLTIRNAQIRTLLFRKEKELDLHFATTKLPEDPSSINFPSELPDEQLDHQRLFQEIMAFIQSKKLYLDPKFNQQSLVTEFGTNRQYLYEAISKNGDDNFRGLVNRFRINEAKKYISAHNSAINELDFGTISEKVGFNSYPTFYRAFKNITGLTPLEFTKELKKDQLG